MATVEARVSAVEVRVEEQGRSLGDLRELIVALDQKIDRRFDAIDRRFDAIDQRFEQVDRRFDAIERRFEQGDRRFESLDHRIEVLDLKVTRQFMWVVGVQLGALGAFTAALIGIIGILLRR